MDKHQENLISGFAFLNVLQQSQLNRKLSNLNKLNKELKNQQDAILSNTEKQTAILEGQKLHFEQQRELKQILFELDIELERIIKYDNDINKYFILIVLNRKIKSTNLESNSFDEIPDKKYFINLITKLNEEIEKVKEPIPKEIQEFFNKLMTKNETANNIVKLEKVIEVLRAEVKRLSKYIVGFSIKNISICFGIGLIIIISMPYRSIGEFISQWMGLNIIFISLLLFLVFLTSGNRKIVAEKNSSLQSFANKLSELKTKLKNINNSITPLTNEYPELLQYISNDNESH